MAKPKVTASIEEVLKEVDNLQKELQKVGKKAFQEGDWVRTKIIIETATRIENVRGALASAGSELTALYTEVSAHLKGAPVGATRKTTKRIPRGKKTPESAYRDPILKALSELGGKAKTSDVLDRVYENMKGVLNEYDKQPVPSVPSQQRWRHTAQIVRNKLVKEGLIKKGSQRGIWELTEAGKKATSAPAPKEEPKTTKAAGNGSSKKSSTKKGSSKKK